MSQANASCPTCGGAVGVVDSIDGVDSYYVPALTGAQVDAAERMVAAIRTWLGRLPPQANMVSTDLLQAARDFESARPPVVTGVGPDRQGEAYRLARQHARRVAGLPAEGDVDEQGNALSDGDLWKRRAGR